MCFYGIGVYLLYLSMRFHRCFSLCFLAVHVCIVCDLICRNQVMKKRPHQFISTSSHCLVNLQQVHPLPVSSGHIFSGWRDVRKWWWVWILYLLVGCDGSDRVSMPCNDNLLSWLDPLVYDGKTYQKIGWEYTDGFDEEAGYGWTVADNGDHLLVTILLVNRSL